MSDRRKAAGIFLLAVAAAMAIIPGLRSVSVEQRPYAAAGRAFRIPETARPGGTVNVNEADLYELAEKMPGIGETLAGMIVEERNANGPFRYPGDLTSVKGIGTGKLDMFRDLVCFD